MSWSAAAATFDHEKLAETARHAFVLPAYDDLAGRLATLAEKTRALCDTPSGDGLAATRRAFRDAIVAWGRTEIITFGPVREAHRFERLFFWPDRKSIGQRQVRALLRKKDPEATAPERLAEKSAAVQGLTALELVLYGDGAEKLAEQTTGQYRCAYAKAIVANVTGMINEIRAGWRDGGDFAKLWHTPGPDNPAYLASRETTLEVVKAFDQAIENVRDRRIAPAIGMGPQRRLRRPILSRSQLTMPLVHANLEGARDLLLKGGLADAYLAQKERSPEAVGDMSSIASEFKLTLQATGNLAAEADPFASEDTKERLVALGFPLKNIKRQAVGLLKQAAGLSVGFNASDGD